MATRKRAKSVNDIERQLERIERLSQENSKRELERMESRAVRGARPLDYSNFDFSGVLVESKRNAARYSRASKKAEEYQRNIYRSKSYDNDRNAWKVARGKQNEVAAKYGVLSPEYDKAEKASYDAEDKLNSRKYVDYTTTAAKAVSNG